MILVVLAAGMGSRYGGLKQMEAFGQGGEALLDYSVFDALQAGFDKVVFVIRKDLETDFRATVLKRLGAKLHCALAFQERSSFIPPRIAAHTARRTKPWGTGHALLCAAHALDSAFTVINADDFYGREAFAVMGKHLAAAPNQAALVPYPVVKTLSPQGGVARALCHIQDGYLLASYEMTCIAQEAAGIFNTNSDGTKTQMQPDTPVSMNIWGFPPSVLADLQTYFDEFLESIPDVLRSECYLPSFANWLIATKRQTIRALPADSEWFGVTYQGDRATARARIAALTASGVYPHKLW
ncbi:MAG: NTP transferase domain-containing protein [Spirochaetaceae bacterium]|jgi:hypothetical protein|nr:NTP transferase domain-containing protein [Spirochaetaceae bacterium]